MIGTDTLDRVIGADVIDADGNKIGTASEVFLDDQSGAPEWVTVKTGMFGTKESFVPIRDADLTGDGLRVPVSKDAVKDAPRIDSDGHLSPAEETELYRHYNMTETAVVTEAPVATETAAPVATETAAPVGHDTSGPNTDDAMTLSEERLRVGTRSEGERKARLRKYVVTENVSETVPVTHEEVRVSREPITDGNVGKAMDGPAISEEEHEVTLTSTTPVVEKEAVPVERVRLEKDTVTENVQVDESLRKEEIETEGVDKKR
ncbi:PRC and DUF2382 domain-containing protein [Modestobacter sp. VKM Ac-2984]|uniref:PRC and DUF2382 domain-containing protein n=1 Tax=Modestobacter sp. VKM Ac-2984 TaxID=3004138 RepID=UPI0022AB1477|nr:PRC and DUF2382 domain-containing protein [Modestobacter sp. VKM Ac-2984]MCZ2815592.1 PRC and DUF2382 domain-containing protein [Modestobacter sp. VKM Ac-2984]